MRYFSEILNESKPAEIDTFKNQFNDPELAKGSINSPENNPEWKETLASYMLKYGFSLVGAGYNGAVFQNTQYPYVLKIYRLDRGYDEWIKFCLSHTSNKYVPRIKGKPIKINNIFTAIRIEPLISSYGIQGRFNRADDEFFESYHREARRLSEGKEPLYDDDMYEIAQFMSKWKDHSDLTRHNIMYSSADKQIKIIDPLYISPSKLAEDKDKLDLPSIEVGDEVMVGKFKNRKAIVKGFTKDDHNQPVLKTNKGDQKLFKPRISKLEEKFLFTNPAVLDWRHGDDTTHSRSTLITLTKDGGAIVWDWGQAGERKWPEFLNDIQSRMDTNLQKDVTEIALHDGDILIDSNTDNGSWSGTRSQYDVSVSKITTALIQRKLVTPQTKIFLGNWAGNQRHEELGTAAQMAKMPGLPKKLILYHGTSSYRLNFIMKNGLSPMENDFRAWKGNRKDPIKSRTNDDAIYFTPSKTRASYYARKAVDVDKRNLNKNGMFTVAKGKYDDLKHNLRYYEGMLEKMPDDSRVEKWKEQVAQIKVDIEKIESTINVDFEGKPEEVILVVEITKDQYKFFAPDDDYINSLDDKSTANWIDSLKQYGQVAFLGTISPDHIKKV